MPSCTACTHASGQVSLPTTIAQGHTRQMQSALPACPAAAHLRRLLQAAGDGAHQHIVVVSQVRHIGVGLQGGSQRGVVPLMRRSRKRSRHSRRQALCVRQGHRHARGTAAFLLRAAAGIQPSPSPPHQDVLVHALGVADWKDGAVKQLQQGAGGGAAGDHGAACGMPAAASPMHGTLVRCLAGLTVTSCCPTLSCSIFLSVTVPKEMGRRRGGESAMAAVAAGGRWGLRVGAVGLPSIRRGGLDGSTSGVAASRCGIEWGWQ